MLSISSRNAGRAAIALRRTFACGAWRARHLSMVSVQHRDDGVSVLSMNRAPVNSLNTQLLTEITEAIKQCEKNKGTKALVVASDVPKIFSAGLDILEMYQPKEGKLEAFWTAVQDVWLTLYGSSLATVAAISGASPAGGCLLAMSCDYRIMAEGKFPIGLNETQLGIVAPPFFANTMIGVVGNRQAERMLCLGEMLPPEGALKVGLIDEVAPLDQVMDRALAEAKKWASINGPARAATKKMVRKANLDDLLNTRQEDLERFVNFAKSPAVQTSLGMYLEALKNKSKK